MRMRKRRRRQNVAWFPNLQQEPDIPEGCSETNSTDWPCWLVGDITVNPAADCPGSKTQVADLTWDFPVEDEVLLNQVPSLADWQGSAWRLRRCVGNLFVSVIDISGNPTLASAQQQVMVGAGLIVLRVDEEGNPTELDSAYSPLKTRNIRDPWIWRRTWILQPQVRETVAFGTGTFLQAYPQSNVHYGTAVGGPYMDAKTNRRIGLEERLFLCIDAQRANPSSIVQSVGQSVQWTFDYRLLGNIMKETNRRNASR